MDLAARPGASPAEVVVLAGGAGTRFAAQQPGADKLAAPLLGSTVVGLSIAGLRPRWPVVVVAHPLAAVAPVSSPGVLRVDEELPTAGPLPAVAVGLRAVRAPTAVLLAGDQPFAAEAVPRLLAALDGHPDADAAVGVDPSGHRQPLLSAVRRDRALAVLDALDGGGRGAPLRALLSRLRVVEVAVSEREALDVDVPADLDRARVLAQAGDGTPT